MKYSIKNFFSRCDQICSFLRIWSHLLKKALMENFIFLCSVLEQCNFQKKSNINSGNSPNLNSSLIYCISSSKKWISQCGYVLVVYTNITTFRSAFPRVSATTLNIGFIRNPIIFQYKKI